MHVLDVNLFLKAKQWHQKCFCMIFSDVKRKQTSRSKSRRQILISKWFPRMLRMRGKNPTAIINLRAKLTSTVFCTWILHDAQYQITRPESFRCQIWHFYSWEFFIIHRGNKKPVSKMKLRPELKVKTIIIKILNHLIQGADLGGRRGGWMLNVLSPLRDSTLCRSKGSSPCAHLRYP